jgi:hypothetical protein
MLSAWLCRVAVHAVRAVRPAALASASVACTTELQGMSVCGLRAGPIRLVLSSGGTGRLGEGCVAYCRGARGSADPSVVWQSPLGLAAVVKLCSGAQGQGRLAFVTSVSVAAQTIRKTSRSTLECSGATAERVG